MNNILYIHQSAELYGSDKTLLYLVAEIKQKDFNPIVVLPSEGPLYDELKKHQIEIIIAPVLKISRKMFSISNLILIPRQIFQAFSIINRHLNGRKIQWVHSNTLAVLIGALYSKRYKIKHLWHVHEIIEHPKWISNLYPKIIDYFSDSVVYNSKATQDFMVNKKPNLIRKSHIVLNGFDRVTPVNSARDIKDFRSVNFKATENEVVIALVGRISRWKGQQLLLNAFKLLNQEIPQARLVFIGSAPPNQNEFLHALEDKIKDYQLEEKVTILPFQNDVWKVWDCIDIAAVPSTEPEPFGLVAIEAMLASKPVVGANHGGLKEIIINAETGFLVEPNDEGALQTALSSLITNQPLREKMGIAGHQRAASVFSLKKYVQHFENYYQ